MRTNLYVKVQKTIYSGVILNELYMQLLIEDRTIVEATRLYYLILNTFPVVKLQDNQMLWLTGWKRNSMKFLNIGICS